MSQAPKLFDPELASIEFGKIFPRGSYSTSVFVSGARWQFEQDQNALAKAQAEIEEEVSEHQQTMAAAVRMAQQNKSLQAQLTSAIKMIEVLEAALMDISENSCCLSHGEDMECCMKHGGDAAHSEEALNQLAQWRNQNQSGSGVI
jgi:multidrug efflux pump subunit AcrA (membrane-fusion protein)